MRKPGPEAGFDWRALDDIDREIVHALRKDARKSFLALSKELGISDATIHKRVGKLERAGVILGYTASLDPELLGYGVSAFIELRIKPGTAEAVGEALARIPNVLDVFELHSHCDILIRVQTRDLRELRNELVNRIMLIPDVVSRETCVVLNVVKSSPGPPPQLSPAGSATQSRVSPGDRGTPYTPHDRGRASSVSR